MFDDTTLADAAILERMPRHKILGKTVESNRKLQKLHHRSHYMDGLKKKGEKLNLGPFQSHNDEWIWHSGSCPNWSYSKEKENSGRRRQGS